MDADDRLVQAKERLARIKRDPERALFSDFKGVSPGGVVTVWVDVLGRMSRIHFAPNSLREGAEPWLIDEVMSAYSSARSSADLLDFDVAELARELDGALRLRDEVTSKPAPRRREPERSGRSRRDDDDDWFGQQSVLR